MHRHKTISGRPAGRAGALLGLCLIIVALAPVGVDATTLIYRDLSDLVRLNEGIVIGTVLGVESVRDADGNIFTFTVLSDLDVVHGRYAESELILRQRGGMIEDELQVVHGAPYFAPGERVLLFLEGNGTVIEPFVGWEQGVFRLVEDEETGEVLVRDSNGAQIVGLAGDRLLKRTEDELDSPRGSGGITEDGRECRPVASSSVSALEPMTLDRFLDEIAMRLQRLGIETEPQIQTVEFLDLSDLSLEHGVDVPSEDTLRGLSAVADSEEPVLPRPIVQDEPQEDLR